MTLVYENSNSNSGGLWCNYPSLMSSVMLKCIPLYKFCAELQMYAEQVIARFKSIYPCCNETFAQWSKGQEIWDQLMSNACLVLYEA